MTLLHLWWLTTITGNSCHIHYLCDKQTEHGDHRCCKISSFRCSPHLDRNGVFNRAIWYKFSTIILNTIKGAAIIWAGSPTLLGGGQGQPKIHHLDQVGHHSNFDCYGSSNMSMQSAGVKTLWVLGPCPIGWGGFDPKTFPGPGNFYYVKSFTMLNACNLLENRGVITPCWRWLVDNFAWFIPFRLQPKRQHLTKLYMERLSFN